METTDSAGEEGDPLAVPAALPGRWSPFPDGHDESLEAGNAPTEAVRDGASWHLGEAADVRWIADRTAIGPAITSAIPPDFDAYATLLVPETDVAKRRYDDALVALLRAHSSAQAWWLGYLETGASDVVFPEARRVRLYSDWPYVLVKAGPDQAARWRTVETALPWHTALPELMFPLDHSWLVSTLWDDDWTCIGGPSGLVDALLASPDIDGRAVASDEDATPPGHTAG